MALLNDMNVKPLTRLSVMVGGIVLLSVKKIHGLKDRATRQRYSRVARPLGRVE